MISLHSLLVHLCHFDCGVFTSFHIGLFSLPPPPPPNYVLRRVQFRCGFRRSFVVWKFSVWVIFMCGVSWYTSYSTFAPHLLIWLPLAFLPCCLCLWRLITYSEVVIFRIVIVCPHFARLGVRPCYLPCDLCYISRPSVFVFWAFFFFDFCALSPKRFAGCAERDCSVLVMTRCCWLFLTLYELSHRAASFHSCFVGSFPDVVSRMGRPPFPRRIFICHRSVPFATFPASFRPCVCHLKYGIVQGNSPSYHIP